MKRLLALFITSITLVTAEEQAVVAVYDIQGIVSESGMSSDSINPFALSMEFNTEPPMTFHDLSTGMERAAADPNVKAIVLDIDDAGLGLAQLTEIRKHLLTARKAGKDVWLYSDYYQNSTAIVGSAANHFMLMPEAFVSFYGLHAESIYFKGLLDKAGLEVDVIHIGDFKSAGEEFYRTEPSEFASKQTKEIVDGLFEEIIGMVAEGRDLPREKVVGFVDMGDFTALQAKEGGLVDDLKYRTEFNTMLREQYAEAQFEHDFGVPTSEEFEVDGIFDLFKLMFNSGKDDGEASDYIAVVVLEGVIDDDTIAPLREAILDKLDDEHAKGLVLRVDSPGGSALASEVLWEATKQWKATGKPFAVSHGDFAASGGYYVSAAADRIFAQPGTITGSIGVVGMKFVVGDALEKIGITTHSTQRGRHAGIMSMNSPFTPDEKKLIRASMLNVYQTFKQRIEDGRGDRLNGELEAMAGGRVYTGLRAKELGLVDEIGGLRDAVAWVTKEAGLEEAESILFPTPKGFFEGIFSEPEQNGDGELVRMGRAAPEVNVMLFNAMQQAGMASLPKTMRAQVQRAYRRLMAAGECKVQLLGPDLRIAW